MTIPIKTLEIKTERVVRAILRGVMQDVTTVEDYDYAISRIESVGWARMHDSVVSNYNNGYIAGGNLIRRHLQTAALPIEHEDPRVAQHTTRLIYGLEQVADGRRNEIQAALRTQYEKGATSTQIRNRMERFFDDDRVAASRFARTASNDIYNAAHLNRYEDSGVVDGVQYSAHIDTRTSDICRVLDQTIWALDDPNIQTPPNHFNCCPSGTKISTINGNKAIEDVCIGDMVLTHKNRHMAVTDTMHNMPDSIIEIKTADRYVRITPDHPVLVRRVGRNVWVPAGELTCDDELVIAN